MANGKPNVKIKTMTYYNKFDKVNKVFDIMTHYSKNIYNIVVFTYNVFKQFECDIFNKLDAFIINNNLSNNELKKRNYKIVNGKKIYEKSDSKTELINKKIYDIYDYYLELYSKNYEIYKKNKINIYNFIKNFNSHTLITNANYYENLKLINNMLPYNKIVNFNDTNKKFVLTDIVNFTYEYFYAKNFITIKNELIHKKPLTIKDKNFIKEVKENNFILIKKERNYIIQLQKKHNIELFSEENIIGRLVYLHLNENKNKLPSDLICNIIKKAYGNIKAYYALCKKGIKSSKPQYLKKDGKFILPYFTKSFKILDSKIRLTVGDNIVDNYSEKIDNKMMQYKNTNYYYNPKIVSKKGAEGMEKLGKNQHVNMINVYYMYVKYPKKLRKYNIKYIEIVPELTGYKVCITYKINSEKKQEQKEKEKTEREKIEESISIDLGMKNLMTIYDPTGIQHIIKGNKIISINEYYVKKISIEQKNKGHDEYVKYLIRRREEILLTYINMLVEFIVKKYEHKKRIIIGYNEGWKTKVKMGKDNNRKFYQIPYSKIISKLKSKIEGQDKELIITEESYTSKCDAITLEEIGKKEKYNGKRISRGLYKSGNGKVINADLNGAINIMRKCYEMEEIKGEGIYNPRNIAFEFMTKLL